MRFWLRDPEGGVANVSSEVLLEIWKTFQEHDIEFPFPQRDVHLDSVSPIDVRVLHENAPADREARTDPDSP